MQRPELNDVSPVVVAYINYLEKELQKFTRKIQPEINEDEPVYTSPLEPDEPPTSLNVFSATPSGIAKRTPRHLYSRQRRGGMGVYDLEVDDEPTTILTIVDENQSMLLITNLGRAFRIPLNAVAQTELHGRGSSIVTRLNFAPGEALVTAVPIQAQGYLAAVSTTGMVRSLRHHVFGEHMKPGTSLYDIKSFGRVAGACWTPGDGDLFIATKSGKAIRFSEKLVPPQGGLGIRVSDEDEAVSVAAVYDDSSVFLLGADGKGTIRLMSSFTPNKSPGAGGKIAMSTSQLIAASTVTSNDDIFITSRLGKIIRFKAEEVPAKDGVVQGVICMSFRSDVSTAMVIATPASK